MKREGSIPTRIGRRFVLLLDALLRQSLGVYEFTQDPACILRLSPMRSRINLVLADGTRIAPGDQLAVTHFWNERLPAMSEAGVDLRWARAMYRHLGPSLELLAQHLARQPGLAEVRALCGEAAFLRASNMQAGTRLLAGLGFEIQRATRGTGAWGRFPTFWQNFYSWLLMWAFNPASLRGRKPPDLERYWLWMSRATLEERYGSRDSGRGIAGTGEAMGVRSRSGPGPAAR